MRIAIVGSGISGLAAAYYLYRKHEVLVFEKESWVGGHACTIEVEDDQGRPTPVDVGFLVYNEKTYPLFTRLLNDIGAPTAPSNMSFSVRCERCSREYASHTWTTALGGSLKQWFRPDHLHMLWEIPRFNRLARQWLRGFTGPKTLGEFVRAHRLSDTFVRHYLAPMTAAIWSAPPSRIHDFPLALYLPFMDNHGLLSVADHPRWRTIRGGSREYVRRLIAPFQRQVYWNTPVRHILRRPHGVELQLDHDTVRVDAVILAVHSDQALALLGDATPAERSALSAIRYQKNEIVLHSDTGLLPRQPRLWSSWNYHVTDCADNTAPLTMTYWINKLQNLSTQSPFLVSLNSTISIDPNKVHWRARFDHPQYDHSTPRAQALLRSLNGQRATYFCGAYLGWGFHEDGIRSAREVAWAIEQERAAA
ncbi:MAG: FAD-dependent oxidoreductase [Candidatus Binatia bacterium]|nr:MAG: FAD-dependent oxidoreductase [Candidatus Binatia bacterium]